MPRGYLALVIELHHPLPAWGRTSGRDWAEVAVGTYWPLLRAIAAAADAGLADCLTLAVSPSWAALAADPDARARAGAELDRRAEDGVPWRSLRQEVADRWGHDPLAPLRRAQDAGTIEVIPTTASHTWLPSVARSATVARAQVALAAADHTLRFGGRPQGIWLPALAYLPGLEKTIAASGLRYFGVDAEAFRRGTVRPPVDVFGPLITPPGAAAFGVDPGPSRHVTDPYLRYARDPRYEWPEPAAEAAADHADHFVRSWREQAERWAPGDAAGAPPISLAHLSAFDLGGGWSQGGLWLEQVLRRLADSPSWPATTPGRYLDRYPEGPVGRPGPSAGGWLSVRPGHADLLDRCRLAADLLADAVERRAGLGPLGRRALAQMARSLLQAQALDWHLPPGHALSTAEALARAERHLAHLAELSGLLAAGRFDPARLAALEAGPPYLPEIDPEQLAEP
ncbi:MAG: DUF1957 domain-containing protein [Isosphaeraceae bacterium]|nr:DUF1957 domain-containing protein [Isosphaeraceae bacterium]